jgi:hypothetical protein
MTRESLIRLRQSDVPGKIPEVEQLELGELVANTYDGRLYLKQAQEDFERIVTFVGKVPIQNTIFVQKNGDDDNNGDSWDSAVFTFEKALELAVLRNNELTLIDVGPGEYFTQGHLDIPDNTLIRSAHRSVVIRPVPGYEERNVFRMGSGCFIEGPVFEGWRVDDLDNPTEGFAVAFRPGAVITRVPYVHKIVVRSVRTWDTVAPPLDRNNQNPYVGRGGGVCLADGAVLSPYSIFPNIMTWGATPVSHNGIGYCAKNGGLINAVNAVSLWAHKHFYAIDGGQIVLSSCSTQFGDFTMVSKGTRNIVFPRENRNTFILDPIRVNEVSVVVPETAAATFSVQTVAAAAITAAIDTIVDDLWNELVSQGYTATWTASDESFTRRDAEIFLRSLVRSLQTGKEDYLLDFAKSLFYMGNIPVFSSDKLSAFVFAFNFIRDEVNSLAGVNVPSQEIVAAAVAALNTTIQTPTVTAITLSVQTAAANAIDSAKNTIIDSLLTELETNGYTVGWDQGDSSTSAEETFTRRDAKTFINAVVDALNNQNDVRVSGAVRDLFYADKTRVFSENKLSAFLFSFNYIRSYINAELGLNSASKLILDGLTTCVIFSLKYPEFIKVVLPSNLSIVQSLVPVRVNDVTIVIPSQSAEPLTTQTEAASAIAAVIDTVVDDLWDELVSEGYTVGWTESDETSTRRDARIFLESLFTTLETANEDYMLDFARSLFNSDATTVFSLDKLSAFVFSFEYMRDQINVLAGVNSASQTIITALVTALNTTIQAPVTEEITLTTDLSAAIEILNAKETVVDDLWTELEDRGYTVGWDNEDEEFTRRDAEIFLDALVRAFISGEDTRIFNFNKSLFDIKGNAVFSADKLDAFIASFNFIRSYINKQLTLNLNSQYIVEGLANSVIYTIRDPQFETVTLVNNQSVATAISNNRDDIIDNMWTALEANGYTAGWDPGDSSTSQEETFTRRDANTFLQSLIWVLETGNEKPILDFVKGLFDYNGNYVFSQDKLPAFVFAFNYMRDEINSLPEADPDIDNVVISLVTALTTTLLKTNTRLEPSVITAIGHTWSGIMAGVALTKIPPARNLTSIRESILELNQGVVISSGQDDQGSALFVGGLEINADTGELTGPPFDQAVNRIATKTSIARSY